LFYFAYRCTRKNKAMTELSNKLESNLDRNSRNKSKQKIVNLKALKQLERNKKNSYYKDNGSNN